jgi:hypothetical protein
MFINNNLGAFIVQNYADRGSRTQNMDALSFALSPSVPREERVKWSVGNRTSTQSRSELSISKTTSPIRSHQEANTLCSCQRATNKNISFHI